jgi:hypothetical protein
LRVLIKYKKYELNHNFNMGPPISAFPMIPSGKTIAIDAAAKAVSDMKRQKNNAGIPYATSRANEERLRRRSRKMAKDFQEAMEKNVKRKIDSMSGSQNNRKVGLKVAQFIPGKGLEVPGAQVENDPSIYCSLGLKGDKLVDPLDETFKRVKGRQVSMDFAFKLINNRDGLLTHDKQTRVTVMNCFRHVNPDSFNKDVTGWHETINGSAAEVLAKQTSNQNWNKTLGPDASLIRRGTGGKDSGNVGVECGTWRGVNGTNAPDTAGSYANTPTNPANTLMSPFRYPIDMEIMYSRVNRQLLENYGWLLNPFKFYSSQYNTGVSSYSNPNLVNVQGWSNPGDDVMDFTKSVSSDYQSDRKSSFPCQINTSQVTSSVGGDGFQWHSQFGPGKLSYQFQNDGTNPVCIDICVVGIKKDSSVPVDLMQHICKYNYAIHKFANNGATNVNGFQSSASSGAVDESFGENEWHDNAKMPFMPDVCFKNPQSYLDAVDYDPSGPQNPVLVAKELFQQTQQGKKNPFKVVKRDQFIVSSGSSRAWNTTLPSIKYRPQLYEDVDYPLEDANDLVTGQDEKIEVTADEYTFVLCIGASGLPKPVEEVLPRSKAGGDVMLPDGTTTTDVQNVDFKAIIDRQPSTCNVSVVGTYKETVYPCYPQDRSSVNFINGRLTEPYFTSEPGKHIPSDYVMRPEAVNTVDIANLGQVVQVADNGIIGVGALNTDIGA